jgi:hypothetical protein
MSRVYKKFEIAQMKYKDDRLRIVTDVLNGIKLVKFYGWEESMQKLVNFLYQENIFKHFFKLVFLVLESIFWKIFIFREFY